MFNWIKKMLGVAEPETLVLTPEQRVDEAPKPTKKKTATKPKKEATVKPKKETKVTLSKLAKKDIAGLAQDQFGVKIDTKKTKDAMIEEFLRAQKAK